MPKRPNAYHRPTNLEEALALLAEPDSVILAGGTKLLAGESGLDADHVVDLQALGFGQIVLEESSLSIGSTCTLTTLAEQLERQFPTAAASAWLRAIIHREGPNTYRNAATIGGTVASRLPDSELLAALLVLDAQVMFAGLSPQQLQLATYLRPDLQQQGLISAVRIDWEAGQGISERVARTPADYAIVSVAAWRPSGGATRLAATGIGLYPQRLSTAEALIEQTLNDETIDAAAEAAAQANRHPGDFRGDANYRAQMARILTRRVLQQMV